MQESRYILVGLGNPGVEYKGTRHNAGFMIIDKFIQDLGGSFIKKKFDGIMWQGQYIDSQIIAVKPMTFMNLSGKCAAQFFSFYKTQPSKLIVIYDDFALNIGTLRIRKGGSDGGHNGVGSIISETGAKDFIKMRIGIGPLPQGFSSVDFVLSKFKKEEMAILEKTIAPNAVEALKSLIKDGLDKTMNLFNRNFI